MGYYATSSYDCRSTAGTSQKHGPCLRVQVSGYRYYDPRSGRWLNRDPLGDLASAGGREARSAVAAAFYQRAMRQVLVALSDRVVLEDEARLGLALGAYADLMAARSIESGEPLITMALGGLNQYVAFNNSPVNRRDPFGLVSTVSTLGGDEWFVEITFAEGWRWAFPRTINDLAGLEALLKEHNKKISTIRIFGHGGVPGYEHMLSDNTDIEAFADALRPYVNNKSLVYWDGCNTGGFGYRSHSETQSPAARLSRILPARVMGNQAKVNYFTSAGWGSKYKVIFKEGQVHKRHWF